MDRGGEVEQHWLDDVVARPLGPNLRNGRQILALLIAAASIFCGVFVPGLRFGDTPLSPSHQASLENVDQVRVAHGAEPVSDHESGSVAGHGKVGAVAGCVIGRHEANKADAEKSAPQTTGQGK